ncbi:MAG: trehalose-phosphatase [Trueperaceae bacterium]|nr:trehalose-phosphatase [Trueperaceae bacterium]
MICDLDGVVTRTAHLHARAWRQMFDDYLARRREEGEQHDPFDIEHDYKQYVDGKPRYDGAQDFLASRGIDLPYGDPDDPAGEETVCGLGNRKNELFRALLEDEGAETYTDAVEQIERWRAEGLKTALITSSRNGRFILDTAGLEPLFDVVVDGNDAAELGLAGKPDPDIFVEAARRLGVAPEAAVVLEDARAGVRAGQTGGFGLVVGVVRGGGGVELREHGADLVLSDLRGLELSEPHASAPPDGLEHADDLLERLTQGRLALFVDYDGTLTPIVDRPEDAVLSERMRARLARLADRTTLAVVSGRDLADVRDKVGLDDLYYAGSHGFDIVGPDDTRMQHEEARASLPDLDEAEQQLNDRLADIAGASVERKRFAIAVHYRRAAAEDARQIEAAVDEVVRDRERLRKKGGKKIFELQPDVDWNKGRAVRWLLERLELNRADVVPVYIGDDVTDEDAFAALKGDGIGIRVGSPDAPTSADYLFEDPDALEQFFGRLLGRLDARQGADDRDMRPWQLVYTRWNPDQQALREALCALGNGHIVTRGAFEESAADGTHYPGTYVAGGYNRLESEVSGRVIENEDLVNWPNWLPLTFRAEGGDWFDLDTVDLLDFDYRLDLRRGLLVRRLRFRDRQQREFSLESRRLVHMTQPHIAAIEWRLEPLNWSGTIEIRSGLDGSVVNDNVERYRGLSNKHLEVLGQGWEADDGMYLTVRTTQSQVRMSQAARTRVFEEGVPSPTRREYETLDEGIAQRLFVPCHERKALRVEKVVSVRTGYDRAISEPETDARKDLRRIGTFAELLRSHQTQWCHLWSVSDIVLPERSEKTQHILRLHIFHLLQTVSTNTIDRDVGVPARGWHGEAYRGHIFWDELFIFPIVLLRIPELARALLMYRYRRLDEARYMARDEGYEGAMYPWQSGSDGREESQVLHLNPQSGRWLPDTTHLQRHVNAAVAYNVWQYYQVTGDRQFLSYYGAEMILEIARFWASIATYDAERDRYVIRGIVGPDEFHTDDPNSDEPGLDNNAYTNVMAAWVLRCACGVLERLDEERREKLREELQLRDEELVRWDDVSRKLFVPFHDDGVISQFEGYEKLAEFDWESYRQKYGETLRLDRILEAEGDDVNRYKASKQADVLMLFYLFSTDELADLFARLGYRFGDETIERTIGYYMARTAHGSTLSQMVHSWILARRDREKAWRFWQQALHSDIDDIQGGTTPEGIHLGAMAGTVDLIQRGHTGMVIADDTLWFDPLLPAELTDARMRLRYRGHRLSVEITQEAFTVSFDRGRMPAVTIGFRGEVFEMEQGESRTFALRADKT